MTASENYLVRITLARIMNPAISRTLSVPKNTPFHKFHEAIQIAFDWAGCHVYKFDALEQRPADSYRTYRITLMSLKESPELNDWTAPEKSTRVTLQQVWDDTQYEGSRMRYLYDFCDNWELVIENIGTESGNGKIKCVAGEGHGPAEDCGGMWGWENLKSVSRRVLGAVDRKAAIQSLNEDDRGVIKWFQDNCRNGDSAGVISGAWMMSTLTYQVNYEHCEHCESL